MTLETVTATAIRLGNGISGTAGESGKQTEHGL